MIFESKPTTGDDGAVTVASQLRPAATSAATKVYDFQDTHVRNTGYPVSEEALDQWYPERKST